MKKQLFTITMYFTIVFGMSPFGEKIVEDDSQLRLKVATAKRISVPPVIDGVLDDSVWSKAIILDQLVQHQPFNLHAPSVDTKIRILYDDNYLYIGFNNLDPNPENISARLGRRDDWGSIENNSDWVGIGFDSNDDDKTGYWFTLSAAEVQLDAAMTEGKGWGGFDITWNAVWEGKTSLHSEGWSAEIRIPFNVFQYSKSDIQTWGASFQRGYYNKQEEIHWPGRALGVNGYVPYFGILKGIKAIPEQRNFEFSPYFLTGQTNSNVKENIANFGLDTRSNISSTSTLNMTFNPDFGQVQADPSVLNLSAFETKLKEKRPFFVQGANFFTSYLSLFNSRRIGKQPGYFEPDSGEIIDRPNETTILGAAKILGETSSGLRYGIINAITDKEYGLHEYELDGVTKKESFLLEPYTNYFIGRLEKPIINEYSTIGFSLTDLHRQNIEIKAQSVNVDWLFTLMENKLSFQGQTASSINSESQGLASRYRLSYKDPRGWNLMSWGGFRDKNFDVSEMGYQEKNNNWYSGLRGEIRKEEPRGFFLNQSLELKLDLGGRQKDNRGDAVLTRKNIELEQDNTLLNYWSFGWDIRANAEVYDDDDIYRDSLAVIIKDEATQELNLFFRTDRRKRFILKPQFNVSRGAIRGIGTEYGLELILKPTDNINFSVKTSKEDRPGSMQWVGVVEDKNGVNIIYSNIKRKQTNTEVRLNIAFSSKMTFEAYYQPFSVKMDYTDYNRLDEEKSFKVSPYPSYAGNKNFEIDNKVGTFVFRWEYLPGSLFYAVYNLNDNSYYSAEDSEWSNSKSNSLFLKFDYFFQL
jgi:hypothetical protein